MRPVRRRGPACLALAGVLVVAGAGPAAANASADAWVSRETDIGASASTRDTVAGTVATKPRATASAAACTYTPLNEEMSAIADDLAARGWGTARGAGPGTWLRKICPDGTGTIVWGPTREVDPVVLARRALDQANIPVPVVQLNPPVGSKQVVNLPMWMWVENFAPVAASASAGSVAVTVTARPIRVVWSMGTGDTVTCEGGGVAYDASRPAEGQRTTCSYTYPHSSAASTSGQFAVRATATWRVTWTATGVRAGGDLGVVNRSTVTAVTVAEIQTLHQ